MLCQGPVWEYFLVNDSMKFSDIPADKIHRSLITRDPVINDAVDGLLREVVLDKAFLKVGPQRASGVRIVSLRPCCCIEPRVACVDLEE
jgi:hypothetical protein